MTFQQLYYLMEVYKTGSVAKAAEKLYVTRPGVSLSINSLENELGYPIFVRTQHGMTPTQKGMQILEYASRILENYKLMNELGTERQKQIRIATANYGPVCNAVTQILTENRDCQDVTFSFVNNYNTTERLQNFNLDIALNTVFPHMTDHYLETTERYHLRVTHLQKIPVVLCIGPGHRLYHKKDLGLSDFDNDVLIDTPTKALSRCSWLPKYVRIDPKKVTCSNHFANDLLVKGIGFSVRRIPSIQTATRLGLRCIPLEGLYQNFYVATNPAVPLVPQAQRFLDILDEEVRNVQYPPLG